MTVVVHLFLRSVIQKFTIVIKNHITLKIIFNVVLIKKTTNFVASNVVAILLFLMHDLTNVCVDGVGV